MKNFLTKTRNKEEQGFTLIELLVVIVIIGVLAAIALPIFLNQQKSSQAAAAKSDLRNAVTSMMTESTKTGGKFPATLPASTTTSEGIELSLGAKGPITANPNLSNRTTTGGITRMSWAEFEQLIGMNTANSTIKAPQGHSLIPTSRPITGETDLYFFFPKTGGSLNQFTTLTSSLCANDTQKTLICNPNVNATNAAAYVYNRALAATGATQSVIVIFSGTSTANPNNKIVGQLYMTDAHLQNGTYDTLLTSNGDSIIKDNLYLPRAMPTAANVSPITYGEPVRPGDETDTFCITATHKSIPDIAYNYNSVTGKISEGKC